jgi:PPM family protein phosphatase
MSSGETENLEVASVTYLSAAASHPGLRRRKNEDRFLIDPLHDFFLVADGMGGHACGEVAAQMAVQTIGEAIRRTAGGDDVTRLKDAIVLANNAIFRTSLCEENLTGMGCVLAALLVTGGTATIANVGDARAYKIHSGRMDLLTTDHSVVGELGKNGEFSEIRLMQHPRRNEVLRCMGVEEIAAGGNGFVDTISTDFRPEHAFLLCSDGLSDLLTSSRLYDLILEHHDSPKSLVRALVDETNAAGGKDNVTAIFVMGNKFPEVIKSLRPRQQSAFRERAVSILLSRWALFVYGIILGITVIFLVRP